MNSKELASLAIKVRPIAQKASDAILDVIARTGQVSTPVEAKADGSPVTQADHAANDLIVGALSSLTPDILVVSEESYLEKSERTNRELYWLVDPLDGTKEFIKGLADYTVNIALIENGTPVLGVIYLPGADSNYYAFKDGGAFKQEGECEEKPIKADQGNRAPIAVVSRSHLNEETESYLQKRNIKEVIKRGSSLKLCAVAEGAADIYPRMAPTYLWDTAAGCIIAREAGCEVMTPDNQPLSYHLGQGLTHKGFVVYAKKMASVL